LLKICSIDLALTRNKYYSRISLRCWLLAFLLLFLLTVMLGVLLILLATGSFSTGKREAKTLLENELTHISDEIRNDFGRLSQQSIQYAQAVATRVEKRLETMGVTPANMAEHPEVLAQILDLELDHMTDVLEKSKSSGAFLILDATVNPELEGAETSRAGLFVKNMEPNIVCESFSNLRLLRGPMDLAHGHGLAVLPQWEMEFDISDAKGYFAEPIEAVRGTNTELSRSYRWCQAFTLSQGQERVVLCSVPLLASDGTVMGVCGFEVSEMLFKLTYMPDRNQFPQLFAVFAPDESGALRVSGALLTRSGCGLPDYDTKKSVFVTDYHDFKRYHFGDDRFYLGYQTEIPLYPSDATFETEHWVFALLLPEDALLEFISTQRKPLLLLLSGLFFVSVLLSLLVSRRYLKPVLRALETLKTQTKPAVKTNIAEIDDLIEFLAAQDRVYDREIKQMEEPSPSTSDEMLDNFVKRIDNLSPAERAVFDLYLEGYSAKEIAELLCLSINTIKTHNKRIYLKLNISSRKELLVYARMMSNEGHEESSKL